MHYRVPKILLTGLFNELRSQVGYWHSHRRWFGSFEWLNRKLLPSLWPASHASWAWALNTDLLEYHDGIDPATALGRYTVHNQPPAGDDPSA